jgi:circadian clock protein KaiC
MTLSAAADAPAVASNPKAPTAIPGVDQVLLGGLPRECTTLIGGGPGTGKTVLALEQLYRAALAGEPGIFLTFEEQADAVRRNARAMGWDLESLERQRRLLILHAEVPTNAIQSGDFDLGGLLAILEGHARALAARRIVIDAADVLLRLFREPHRQKDQTFLLYNWLTAQALTAVLTVKVHGEDAAALYDLEYMADCVIRLDHRVVGQVATRRLRVLKFRGSGFLSNEHPYVISPTGIALMPVSAVELPHQPLGEKFSTGIRGLDDLVGSGFTQGACILIGGASGTGKTTVACSLAETVCRHGKRVLYVSLEESIEGLFGAMRSPGLDLHSAVKSGTLSVLTAMPEAMGVEEHLWRLIQEIDRFDPQHLIVDAISACNRMGSEEAGFEFLVRLLTYCKSRGITCIYLNQMNPKRSIHLISGFGISSLVDAVFVLEQEWSGGDYRRLLYILKVRGTRHSHTPHTFRITDHGIQIEDAATSMSLRQGVRS